MHNNRHDLTIIKAYTRAKFKYTEHNRNANPSLATVRADWLIRLCAWRYDWSASMLQVYDLGCIR